MKQIALLSLFGLAGILLIQGNDPFATSGGGLRLVEVKPESTPDPATEVEVEVDLLPRIDQEQAERLVDSALNQFRKDLDAAQQAFENRINSAFESARAKLLQQLQTRVDDKIGRMSLLRQTIRMATDMITSGPSRAQEWMKENFEDPLRPIIEQLTEEISMARHQWVLDRDSALSALETTFLKDIPLQLEESAQAAHLVGGEILGGVSRGGNRAAASLGLTGVVTGVFLKSDVADLKKPPAILKTLSAKSVAKLSGILNSTRFQKIIGKRLTPIAKRFAKEIAASGVLVVADGPLPIGDLVAVVVTGVSSVWTIYEVWNLGSGARTEIMKDAAGNFSSLEAEIRVEVLEPVRRDHQELLKAIKPLSAALLGELANL